jgi:transcriptional regulator with XRE-family HTH domain
MIRIKFAENLKLLMKESSLNQVTLSKATGIAQSAISSWLSGKKEPSITSLWILSDLFNCTIDELVGRKDL